MKHQVTFVCGLCCALIAPGLLGLSGCSTAKESPPPAVQNITQTTNETIQSKAIKNSSAGDDFQRGQAVRSSSNPGGDVQVSQVPGQYDVMEGTAIQLRAQNSENNPDIKDYRWEIIEGNGGRLLNADTAVVTFYAPNITSDSETFTLKLTTEFANGKSSSASMIIRVHKQAAQSGTTTAAERRYGISPWFTGTFGFGLGYLWNYPVYVPFYIPVPDKDLRPEDLPPSNPEPLTPKEIQDLPDNLRPEVVLPETVEFPQALPVEPESDQTQLGTDTPPIEAVPAEPRESPTIETTPEVESAVPSIGIEPALQNEPEMSLPPDVAPSMDADPAMDIPMDAGEF